MESRFEVGWTAIFWLESLPGMYKASLNNRLTLIMIFETKIAAHLR